MLSLTCHIWQTPDIYSYCLQALKHNLFAKIHDQEMAILYKLFISCLQDYKLEFVQLNNS